jgi:uncharacterized protein YjbJ (UPF0337 family)
MSMISSTANGRLARALPLLAALALIGIAACESGKHNVADGNAKETKGKVETTIGDVTGNDNKKAEGKTDEDKGKTQKAVGKAEEKVDRVVDKAANP